MNVLGQFEYAGNAAGLLADPEEEFFLVCRHEKGLPPETKSFDDLGTARSRFEDIVHAFIYRTSYTDVSIFMQQGA